MKKLFGILVLIAMFGFAAGCKTSQTEEDAPYYRTGSKQEVENKFRDRVFAPYMYEGKVYAVYALAKIVKQKDKDGYYTVRFTNGPSEGTTIRTKDVVLKTTSAEGASLQKGDVVMADYHNPLNPANSPLDRWNKAVVYDVSKMADGRVVIEHPHDRNDFMATRQTVYPQSLRYIDEPATRDPRTFLP